MVKLCFNIMDAKMTLLNLNKETYGHRGTKGHWASYLFAVTVSK